MATHILHIHRSACCLFLVMGVMAFHARYAHAIRPFITDDARVVGKGQVQLETWLQVDDGGLQHWLLPAFGPNDWMELTIGGLHGAASTDDEHEYSAAGPLLQGKVLLHPARLNDWPGFAVAAGAIAPSGSGGFAPSGWTGFGFAMATANLVREDEFLIHANVGGALQENPKRTILTLGLGTQIHVVGRLHGIVELVRGDAYTGAEDGAWQTGFRFLLSDSIQIDTTVGEGFMGEDQRPFWASIGLRLVSHPLW